MKIIEMKMINGANIKYIEIYDDGKVVFNKNEDNKKTINLDPIINYIENISLENIKKSFLDKYCEIKYKDNIYNCLKIYSDLEIMIRTDKVLDVINNDNLKVRKDNEEKKKNNQKRIDMIHDAISVLDRYEETKIELNPYCLEEKKLSASKNIISFNLMKKDIFELGESRILSNTIDIADSVNYPKELEFFGQINLEEFSKYDKNKLLPSSGHLYFFDGPSMNDVNNKCYQFGKVIYSNDDNLVRKEVLVFSENLVKNFKIFNIKDEFEVYKDRIIDGEFNNFIGEEKNKIYGYYTDPQMDEDEIKLVSENYIVLLQIGSELYGEGITTFLIKEEDLKNRIFDNVIYTYSQT